MNQNPIPASTDYLVVHPDTGEIVATIDKWFVEHVYSKEFTYWYEF